MLFQLDVINTAFHPKAAEHTFFISARGTLCAAEVHLKWLMTKDWQ